MDTSAARDLPTVTMAVISYNQEKTIGYAVNSALAQDYEGPLTIGRFF